MRVNLPRWGLKPKQLYGRSSRIYRKCKFTPLGFETSPARKNRFVAKRCKFTPLGFETAKHSQRACGGWGVNLPRWGLKLHGRTKRKTIQRCKFTPLGFETIKFLMYFLFRCVCKFTPLGFETAKFRRYQRRDNV